ncbi:MAG TPA: ATP-binding protein [Kofleriaceae bacterium]|nr:ATP-binding protein [Kofleriaceae bacterium]
MQVVILERNKLVARKVARLFTATGAAATAIEDPAALPAALSAADLVCADTFDGDVVAESVRARPGLRGLLWTAEPLRRSLRYLVETTAIDHVLARRDFESPPRAWELTMIARRMQGVPAPPLGAYLDWGFTALDIDVRATADRDAASAAIQDFVGALGVPRRIAEMFAELGHELIMNAMYDAPIDAFGRVKYAGDRKAEIVLADHERPAVRIATDGTRLALQVRDPFGRLERRHVVDGLARGLAGGQGAEMDRSRGGAGLGLMVCHNASTALWFDVVPNRHTEVTALLELDMNLREFRTQARSLHFWRP